MNFIIYTIINKSFFLLKMSFEKFFFEKFQLGINSFKNCDQQTEFEGIQSKTIKLS
jgi:hypothetical protein